MAFSDHPPTSTPLQWRYLPFDALDIRSLYDLLRLRSEVFVVEQRCVFPDMDGADEHAMHLLGQEAQPGSETVGPLRAYARCFPAGVKYEQASVGRVVTHPEARGTGLGHQLVAEAIQRLLSQWGPQPIRIGAQAHLRAFYERHGFAVQGEPYMEDGILHLEMLRAR